MKQKSYQLETLMRNVANWKEIMGQISKMIINKVISQILEELCRFKR